MTGPVLTHAERTAAGYEPERVEHQVAVVFDLAAATKFHAAQALADTLSGHGLLGSLRAVCDGRGARLDSWWFPQACFKHIDHNDNAPMRLVADEPLDAEKGLAWVGTSVAQIRSRWADDGPAGPVLAACGEHRIPSNVPDHDVLEALRAARSDVQYLLAVLDRCEPRP